MTSRDMGRTARVLELWNTTGLSARDVAERLGLPSRNTVIGIVNRNRDRVTRVASSRILRSAATRRQKAELPPPEPIVAPTGQPCGARDATAALSRSDCRYPLGDPQEPGFHYCCAKTEPGRSYCRKHAALTYTTESTAALSRVEWRNKQRELKTGRRAA